MSSRFDGRFKDGFQLEVELDAEGLVTGAMMLAGFLLPSVVWNGR
jgi:hypothetical protein